MPPVITVQAEPFTLGDVRLLNSPFKAAMERNAEYLLKLEPDRFLHTFRLIAGLPPKAPRYGGWESPTTGAGRCLGHYLSALAEQYAATGDARFKERLDYTIDELALCQEKNGEGYLSAMQGVRELFAEIAKGNGDGLGGQHPWYILHKTYAGLRDAYLLGGNSRAREVMVKMADWAVATTLALDDANFQKMLRREEGGMREIMADVYAITGDRRYLALAVRFSNAKLMEPLSRREDRLTGYHANTQVPRLLGAARVYEFTGEQKERIAAEFFWETVVRHHSYVIGGNSLEESFGPPDKLAHRLGTNTAETCNTHNMLKLTRRLFTWEPKVEYADYYERALYNHILASQDPRQGGFTYFVSLKPGHFRTYSSPFDSFWCCVGTGMENHTKYGDSIYFHDARSLYVNLFIPSELKWKEKGITVRQETKYPESGSVEFTLACPQPVKLAIKIRHPAWAGSELRLRVNGEVVASKSEPGTYATVEREWKDGDRLAADIPLGLRTEAMPDNPDKLAILYGPLVLGGQIDSADLQSPIPYARGNQLEYQNVPDPAVPVLVTNRRPVSEWVEAVAPLTFRTKGVGQPIDVTLVPFQRQYHERSVVYWDTFTSDDWQRERTIWLANEERRKESEARRIDQFRPGEPQSETDHRLQGERTNAGLGSSGVKYRHAVGGWFAFEMKVRPDVPTEMVCTYWGENAGRTFDILVDGELLATETIVRERPNDFVHKTYALPSRMTQGKDKVTIRFQAQSGQIAGGVFGCATFAAK